MEKDARISFRANSATQAGLAQCAEGAGCSVSEYLRTLVEQDVARAEVEKAVERFDPFSKLSAAARGSRQAQRDIANQAVAQAFEPNGGFDPVRCLEEGLIFARLAAAQGDAGDQGLVISIIALLAHVVGEENVPDEMAEALARVSAVADKYAGTESGDLAAEHLGSLADSLPPEVVAVAQDYEKRLRQGAA